MSERIRRRSGARRLATAAAIVAVVAGALPAPAQLSWILWEISDTVDSRVVGSVHESIPINYRAIPVERDLDVAACETLKEERIQARLRSFPSARPVPDGAITQTRLGDTLEITTTLYLCLRAGVRPPAPARRPAPRGTPPAADCRIVPGPDGSETLVCGNR